MLFGMNAHISRDLPFALERARIGERVHEDHDRVNGLLADVQEQMLERAAERLDPSIATYRLPAFEFAARELAALMGTWRDEA